MITAAVGDTGYNIMVLLHVALMFVAFAPAFVHPFLDVQTQGTSYRAEVWARIVPRSQRIHGGALILSGLLGFGIAGMSDEVYKMSDGWLLASVLIWVAMNGALHALIIPGERAVAAGDESKAPQLKAGSAAITLLWLVTLYLMVFKPGA